MTDLDALIEAIHSDARACVDRMARHCRRTFIISVELRDGMEKPASVADLSETIPAFRVWVSKALVPQLLGFFTQLVETGAGQAFLREAPLSAKAAVRLDPAQERALAYMLTRIAIGSIFLHELAHIRNGHVALLSTGRNLSNRERQSLEIDADCFATCQSIQVALRWKLTVNDALFWWAFATYGFLRRWAITGSIFEDIDEHVHTPAQVRMGMCIKTGKDWVTAQPLGGQFEFPPMTNGPDDPIVRGMTAAEIAYARVTGELDMVPFWQAFSEEVERIIDEHHNTWRELHPLLDPLALGGNLVPPRPSS